MEQTDLETEAALKLEKMKTLDYWEDPATSWILLVEACRRYQNATTKNKGTDEDDTELIQARNEYENILTEAMRSNWTWTKFDDEERLKERTLPMEDWSTDEEDVVIDLVSD